MYIIKILDLVFANCCYLVYITVDLNDSENFLINQTINCLSLFALSCGELALSADCSRYVLKRQGSLADAGIWIMRGLALTAIGMFFFVLIYWILYISRLYAQSMSLSCVNFFIFLKIISRFTIPG